LHFTDPEDKKSREVGFMGDERNAGLEDSRDHSLYEGGKDGDDTLQDLRDHLDDEEEKVKKLQKDAKRDVDRLSEDMKGDIIELLEAFGLPYLIAPYEAEAQCAVLEELGLVSGVVTEDSDTFLFGAKHVYKNIFDGKKFVEVYKYDDVVNELGLTREDLVALAFFLGSDYTEGILGVGIVNAMEIIQAFPMNNQAGGPLKGLASFKKWLQGYSFASELPKTTWYSSSPPIKNSIFSAKGCSVFLASSSLHNLRRRFKSKLDLIPNDAAIFNACLTVAAPLCEIAQVIPVV
jgi:5'-3' exonuclease